MDNRPPDAAWVATRLADMLPDRPATPDIPDTPDYLSPPVRVARPRGRRLAIGGVGLLALLAVVLVLLPRNNSGQQAAGPPTVRIDLAPPQDLTNHVVLNWTSQRPLDFVVVVQPAGQPDRYPNAKRNHTITLSVDPTRKYCFLIRGTDEDHIYQSRPAAIRGATCRE